jgi:hypothetical protein
MVTPHQKLSMDNADFPALRATGALPQSGQGFAGACREK